MSELIEFETERLRLRQWIETDREPFARLSIDPQVMEFFPNLLDRTASDAMVDRLQVLIAERGWGLWAVEAKADRNSSVLSVCTSLRQIYPALHASKSVGGWHLRIGARVTPLRRLELR